MKSYTVYQNIPLAKKYFKFLKDTDLLFDLTEKNNIDEDSLISIRERQNYAFEIPYSIYEEIKYFLYSNKITLAEKDLNTLIFVINLLKEYCFHEENFNYPIITEQKYKAFLRMKNDSLTESKISKDLIWYPYGSTEGTKEEINFKKKFDEIINTALDQSKKLIFSIQLANKSASIKVPLSHSIIQSAKGYADSIVIRKMDKEPEWNKFKRKLAFPLRELINNEFKAITLVTKKNLLIGYIFSNLGLEVSENDFHSVYENEQGTKRYANEIERRTHNLFKPLKKA